MLRELRDGVLLVAVHPPMQRRDSSVVGASGQNTYCGKQRRNRLEIAFGGEGDDEYLLWGMMWADNNWLFSDDKEKLTLTLHPPKKNDVIIALLKMTRQSTNIY